MIISGCNAIVTTPLQIMFYHNKSVNKSISEINETILIFIILINQVINHLKLKFVYYYLMLIGFIFVSF